MTRVQLDLAPAQMERLNGLMEVSEIKTRTELINVALTLFEWAVKQVIEGKSIASIDQKSEHYRELEMPALAAAARNQWRPAH